MASSKQKEIDTMKAKLEFVWFNGRFIPNCHSGDGGVTLAGYLMSDMQTSVASINRITKLIDDVAQGRAKPGYMGGGNSCSICMINNMVFIEEMYYEEYKILISNEQFLHVLEEYKRHIDADYDDPNTIPPPIEFEYIAEGDEAYDLYEATGGSLGLEEEDYYDG